MRISPKTKRRDGCVTYSIFPIHDYFKHSLKITFGRASRINRVINTITTHRGDVLYGATPKGSHLPRVSLLTPRILEAFFTVRRGFSLFIVQLALCNSQSDKAINESRIATRPPHQGDNRVWMRTETAIIIQLTLTNPERFYHIQIKFFKQWVHFSSNSLLTSGL